MTVQHVDTLIVGSGFGGSVVAFRLAEAGRDVLLLERGKSYAPGSFARTPEQMQGAFWDPSEGQHGMFDLWAFENLDAMVASGLGGGSLIYANVLLRKDEEWFHTDHPTTGTKTPWPFTRADLDPHYDNALQMLQPQQVPLDEPGYALDKTLALRDAAAASGLEWQPVDLAVRFANDGTAATPGEPLAPASYGNLHDRPRRTCTLCGECDIGCNEGAKNTLDHTYLSAAANHGAEIRTRSEVRRIARKPDGRFEVTYVEHRAENEGHKTATRKLAEVTVTADRVVMGAGALGSTYLLMKNRGGLAGLSPTLGSNMCGNGDLLGFLLNARNSDGSSKPIRGYRGPVITSTVRVEQNQQLAYIQDAGFPAFMSWIVEATQIKSTARRALGVMWDRVMDLLRRDWDPQLGQDIRRILGPGEMSSSSMPLLGMGVDIADGSFGLEDNRLTCDWKQDRSAPHFSMVIDTMKTICDAMDADLKINPSWMFKRVITVHALGGCPASESAATGVVDSFGQAHDVPGLWVVDGAAIPGAVGPNPSLTIAAFADRAAERMLST